VARARFDGDSRANKLERANHEMAFLWFRGTDGEPVLINARSVVMVRGPHPTDHPDSRAVIDFGSTRQGVMDPIDEVVMDIRDALRGASRLLEFKAEDGQAVYVNSDKIIRVHEPPRSIHGVRAILNFIGTRQGVDHTPAEVLQMLLKSP
jgi:hypothetical protein